MRVVKMTPPGSACSVVGLHLVVDDLDVARRTPLDNVIDASDSRFAAADFLALSITSAQDPCGGEKAHVGDAITRPLQGGISSIRLAGADIRSSAERSPLAAGARPIYLLFGVADRYLVVQREAAADVRRVDVGHDVYQVDGGCDHVRLQRGLAI